MSGNIDYKSAQEMIKDFDKNKETVIVQKGGI